MGTDAGNPLTLHGPSVYAEMEAMQARGPHADGGARRRRRAAAPRDGRGAELGTVEAGKLADLLVLGADPTADVANVRKVQRVVRGGVSRTLDELRAPAAR